MEKIREGTFHITSHAISHKLLKGLGWGFLGGLIGTLVMDLLPAHGCHASAQATCYEVFFHRRAYAVSGGKKIENVYFHQVSATYDETKRGYLEQAYQPGKDFAG